MGAREEMFDPLTGLPARALLMDRLQQAIFRSARSGDPVAVVCEAPDRGIDTIVERVSRVTHETLDLGEGSHEQLASVIGVAFADGSVGAAEALERAEAARDRSRELGREHLLYRESGWSGEGASPP